MRLSQMEEAVVEAMDRLDRGSAHEPLAAILELGVQAMSRRMAGEVRRLQQDVEDRIRARHGEPLRSREVAIHPEKANSLRTSPSKDFSPSRRVSEDYSLVTDTEIADALSEGLRKGENGSRSKTP